MNNIKEKALTQSRKESQRKCYRFRFPLYMLCLCGLIGCLVGCGAIVPAKTPAQLEQTPGASVILTDQLYDAGSFHVRYPGGWQVITGAASAPTWVVFISPDELRVIALSTESLDPAPQPPLQPERVRSETQTLTLTDGSVLYAFLSAPESDWQTTQIIFQSTLDSITPSPSSTR